MSRQSDVVQRRNELCVVRDRFNRRNIEQSEEKEKSQTKARRSAGRFIKGAKIDLHGVLGVDHRDQTRASRIDEKQSIEEKNDHQPMGHQRGDSNDVRQ